VSTKYSLIVILALVIISCSKDEKIFIPDQNYNIDQELLLKQIIEVPKKYKISLTNERFYFSAPNGSHIEIPPLALKNEAGQAVTGDVIMTFDNLELNKSQLLYAPSTIYDGKMFESQKMIHLDFSQEGKPLVIDTPISVIIPANDNKGNESLILLDGVDSENIPTTWARRNMESYPLTVNTYEVGTVGSQNTVKGYKILCESNTKWIAIAKSEVNNANKPVITCLMLDQTLNLNNSVVYFISKNGRSAFQLQNTGKNEWRICTNALIPNDLSQGTFVLISDLGNENYHFGMTNAVLETDVNVVITSKSKTNKEIKEILASL